VIVSVVVRVDLGSVVVLLTTFGGGVTVEVAVALTIKVGGLAPTVMVVVEVDVSVSVEVKDTVLVEKTVLVYTVAVGRRE